MSVVRVTIPGMAYDHALAEEIRALVAIEPGVLEQRMFGGLAFLINGNMSVSASGQGGLLVRVDPEQTEELLDGDRVRLMVMGGRRMRGWLHVDPAVVAEEEALREWVTRSVSYARTLPAKKATR
jgi:hypothetical protein